ncbi:hypothetical protein P3W70_07195 [Achromobacter denitrificans]|uniref:hypothetical protein n=1 Tax=Achromobacter denitrificans TaxID=32002 RepID=UPI0023E7F4A2|nr:hypothetical protein [Achromobacter denitrificans]MDF3858124.1 hypothetical protein [Achromobacter denitrificans]
MTENNAAHIAALEDLRLGVEMDRHHLPDGDAKIAALDAALASLRTPVADERALHDNWYSRTHMHEYSRDATWRGWQARAALASALVAAVKIHRVKLKSRREMERTIPSERMGWWRDVSPGQQMVLRDATAADLERCILREGDTRGPEHFLCELEPGGALVSREAIEHCRTIVMPVSALASAPVAGEACKRCGGPGWYTSHTTGYPHSMPCIDCNPQGVSAERLEKDPFLAAQLWRKPVGFADAYEGAREDLAIWKRRALEAERDLRAERETSSRLVAALNAENGPTHMGEPAPQASEAVRDALWTLTEHNALHFGEQHSTVIQGRAALSAQPGAQRTGGGE